MTVLHQTLRMYLSNCEWPFLRLFELNETRPLTWTITRILPFGGICDAFLNYVRAQILKFLIKFYDYQYPQFDDYARL